MTLTPKQKAAEAALGFVPEEGVIGLGSGSTADEFIKMLGKRVQGGADLRAVCASSMSEAVAREAGIPLVDPDETTVIEVYVDGADEANRDGHLIKGGGAALLREKILATAAKRFVVIADRSKDVAELGRFPLPIEIEPFGWGLTVREVRRVMSEHGFGGADLSLRPATNGAGFLSTDGGNYIIDARLERISDPEALDRALTMLPGVVTTGLFVNLADTVIFGSETGVEKRDV